MMTRFRKKLAQLEAQNRLRSLALPHGIDLTSNDYLSMRSHPALRAAALETLENGMDLGSSGSRLLRGHTEYHAALEDYAARYFGFEKTLYFATGYQANMVIFATLPSRHDIIIYDELIHASARDGIRSSNASAIKIRHNDLNDFERILQKSQQKISADGRIWMAVESLYSMDGDIAPLSELLNLAQKYDAFFIIDEAHAGGVIGEKGKGLCADLPKENLIVLHTCGKAIGVAGGLVCASEEIINYLINCARSFIYSTAPPPFQAFLVQKSLEILGSKNGDERREKLKNICKFAQQKFSGHGTHIVPIVLGSDETAIHVAKNMQQNGYDIRAIRPPTVPEGTARLRLSLSSELSEETLADFAAHLEHYHYKDAA